MTVSVPIEGTNLQLRSLAVLIAALLWGVMFQATADDLEFNTDILDVHDKANIDLSRFSRAGYIMPGHYIMTLEVNKDDIPDLDVEWVVPENDPKGSMPCLTSELVADIGLKNDVRQKLTWSHGGQCLDLKSLPGAEARGDLGKSILYLGIPQAWLEYRAPNWEPPSHWDSGIAGILLDYYVSAGTRQNNNGGSTRTVSGNGTAGGNWGPWRLRADWQANMNRGQGQNSTRWDWSRYYAYRALPSLGAKLTMGEDSLYSNIFDSFRFTGASLQSDDNMLPPNLKGYAPEVTGTAKTNAKVIISQQGRVLEETQVAAGPFRIQDLNGMVSGTLDVRVEEQDGTVQTFTVNTATVPYLTRPGLVRYKLAAGRPSGMEHHADGPEFTTGEFSWGVNNGWSLYGGGIGSKEYKALALGIGRDLMKFGAMSFDVTRSQASLPHEDGDLGGASYRLSYSKRFDETNSQVTFAGYRFSERNFMSMGEYLDSRHDGERKGSSKELYTITFSQQIPEWGVSAFLNYSHQTYWDQPKNDRYTLTLSHFFDVGVLHNLSMSATAFRNSYFHTTDNGMYLSVSVPWGSSGTFGYSGSYGRDGNSHQVNYYDRIGDHDSYQLSSGLSRQGNTANGYWDHDGDMAHVNANANYQPDNSSMLSLSVQGGMTVTAQGAALHRSNQQGAARMMVDTGGVPDIPVRGFGNTTNTNYFGKAVVTDVGSYYRNQVSIDLNALPDNAEASRSVVQDTLTEGAIGYRKFDVVSGSRAMAVLRLTDGSYPPFGATVQNTQGQNTGIVGDEGNVYLSGMHPGDKMTVQWGSDGKCVLALPPSFPGTPNPGLLLPCTTEATRAPGNSVASSTQSTKQS